MPDEPPTLLACGSAKANAGTPRISSGLRAKAATLSVEIRSATHYAEELAGNEADGQRGSAPALLRFPRLLRGSADRGVWSSEEARSDLAVRPACRKLVRFPRPSRTELSELLKIRVSAVRFCCWPPL